MYQPLGLLAQTANSPAATAWLVVHVTASSLCWG